MLGSKHFCLNLGSKNILSQEKILHPKKFYIQKFWFKKELGSKFVSLKYSCLKKKLDSENIETK